MKLSRVSAYTLRHLYLYKRSVPRLMEVFYWPLLDLVIWGFVSVYLATHKGGVPEFVAFFVGALILWDMLFRSQQGISVSFLEDVWSRNLVNIFVSPMGPGEYVSSLVLLSFIKLVISSSVMILLAYILYSFDMLSFGFQLVPLIANLMVMGWAVGIFTTAVILRFGQEVEVFAWGIGLLFQPFSAVFYPVSVLPSFMQAIAACVPSSYVFEGMRQVVSGGPFPAEHLAMATGLNVLYMAGACLFFIWNFSSVKKRGGLAKVGE